MNETIKSIIINYRIKADCAYSEVEDGVYTQEQYEKALENILAEAKRQTKELMLEVIEQAIDKTKDDKEKISSAHELYSGSIDANSYRMGWDMALENLRQEQKKGLEEI